jgi:hypothetical protein
VSEIAHASCVYSAESTPVPPQSIIVESGRGSVLITSDEEDQPFADITFPDKFPAEDGFSILPPGIFLKLTLVELFCMVPQLAPFFMFHKKKMNSTEQKRNSILTMYHAPPPHLPVMTRRKPHRKVKNSNLFFIQT